MTNEQTQVVDAVAVSVENGSLTKDMLLDAKNGMKDALVKVGAALKACGVVIGKSVKDAAKYIWSILQSIWAVIVGMFNSVKPAWKASR